MKKTKLIRHSPLVRLCHWLIAISGLFLCFTGIGTMPLYGRFFINDIPGLAWSSDLLLQLKLHYLGAAIFAASSIFHLVYHWRRNEISAWPQKGDWQESLVTIKAMLKGSQEPKHGKFLAEQRLAYAFFVLISLLLFISGWILAVRQLSSSIIPADFLQIIVLTHLLAGMLFLLLAVGHLLAFLPRANRKLLPTMFSGKIDADYAQKRHPLWRTRGDGE